MPLTYRRIEAEKHFARQIWKCEQSAQEWFKASGNVWTPTYKSFLKFWKSCAEIYGLFEGEKLLACVYLEFTSETSINIHVSVVGKVENASIVRFFASLRRLKSSEGVSDMRGWILSRNRHLIAIAEKAGFRRTGLKMIYGQSRGRVLQWIEVYSGS